MRIKYVKNAWTFRVRKFYFIQAYFLFIQLERHETVCNPEVNFVVNLMPNFFILFFKIFFQDPQN